MTDRSTRTSRTGEAENGPRNAFSRDFLRRMDLADEPESAREAEFAGPWTVRAVPYQGGDGYAALRHWESLERGDRPYAVFLRREMALLAAAVLPGNGRDALFHLRRRLDSTVEPPGFAIAADQSPDGPESAAQSAPEAARHTERLDVVAASDNTAPPDREARRTIGAGSTRVPGLIGHVRDFDEGFVAALHVAATLVRSPEALARLLEAAGYLALEQAGKILYWNAPGPGR